ncbi:MAG: IS66 family transposase [Proteobacteria bacterium]|nr:IS66 family transposase [Pseudomonadota bacterium]
MSPQPLPSSLSPTAQDALITALLEEIAALKAQLAHFEGLSARIGVLEAENAALKAENAALREQLGQPPKTPSNSSKPPSTANKANGDGKKNAPKAKVHPGAHRPLHPNPTSRRDFALDRCPNCQADVTGVAQAAVQTYDRIEIPEIKPDVTRVTLYGGACPCCAAKFKAQAPAGLEPGSPFGPNLRAFALYLRYDHAISFERLERLMLDLFGLEISEGALANLLATAKPAFDRQAALFRARLLSGTILQSDETGARVNKKGWWLWVFHYGDTAYFVLRPSRGKKVVAEFLGDVRPDYWVSDRLAAQAGWAAKEQQVCLAHLLRYIKYAIDCGDDAFGPSLKTLLKWAIRMAHRRSELAAATLVTYHSKLQSKLDKLLEIEPTTQAGRKLQRIIKKCRQSLFVFVTNPDIPPTNNGSEQALRPCATFRKVTNCFRSEWGANLYAGVRSVIETARRRGIGILNAIRLTLEGRPLPLCA